MNIYNKTELESIGTQRMNEIKKNAINENKIYYEKINSNLYNYERSIMKSNPTQAIVRGLKHTYVKSSNNYLSLFDKINHLAFYSPQYKLVNDIEKTIFLINGIFVDDEEYLKKVTNSGNFKLLDQLMKIYDKLINSKNDKNKYSFWLTQLKHFSAKNRNELGETLSYFVKFHSVNSFDIIINRLLQVYYYNTELYNSYLENTNIKEEKVKQKSLA